METSINPNAYSDPHREMSGDLIQYLQALYHEKKKILSICVVFFITSAVYLAFIPNSYETEVQILVEQLGDVEKFAPQTGSSNFKGEDDYYGTQVAIITGKKISNRVKNELGVSGGSYVLTARRLRGTRIISVSVKSKDAKLAARAANKTIDVYIQEKGQDDLFIAKQMLKWLPNQIEQTSEGGSVGFSGKSQNKGGELLLTSEADDAVYQQLRQSRMEAESKRSEMSFRYKPNHPIMKELEEKLSYLDQQIKERKEALLSSLKASLMGDFHLTNIKILSPAPVPLKPASPKRLNGIFLATMMGFFVSVCFVIYIEQADPRIWYETEIRNALDVPFMGYVPVIESLASRKDKKDVAKGKVVELSEDLKLQNLLKVHPTLADSIAFMRTHLFFSAPQQKSKILLMTSTTPNEGKSTVIALFALSLASMGKKVLIIDSDLRRPYLHTQLAMQNQKGLAEYLSGEASYQEVFHTVPDSTLKAITGGVLKVNSAQLLSSSTKLKELLETAADEYDYILIDAPPVLFIPDGLIIAKYAQGVVLITSAGMIRRHALQAVKHKFDAIARPVMGVVINRADHSMDMKFKKYFKQYQSYYYTEIPKLETEKKTEKK